MNIVLERLEEKFLATALKNGLSYWKKDQFEIIENNATSLKARVYGTDEYLSELTLKDGNVVDVNCTCPNNRTLFCKHIAILYYDKFKDVLDLKKAKPRKASKRISNKKNKLNIFSLESAINNLSQIQLKEIIFQEIKNNVEFKLFLDRKLNPKNKTKQELYKYYKTQIQQLFRKHKKQGYINYSSSNTIGKAVVEYADKASEYYEKGLYEESFEVCRAIIDTMVKPLYYTDTSSGIFYQGLDEVLSIMLSISNTEELQPTLRNNIYNFFLKLFNDKNNHGWGYETSFVDILIQIAENNKEKEEVLEAIHSGGIDNYTLSLYKIIKKFDGDKAAKSFVEEHKLLPEFRIILFEEFILDKNYEAAKQCMYEGIQVNEEYPGIVISWIKNLLTIGELTSDRDLIIKSSKALFLNLKFNRFPQEADYYEILKSQFSKDIWEKELHLLLEKVEDKASLEEIYYREGNLELLIKSISETEDYYFGNNFLNFNNNYIKSLLPKYKMQIKELLQNKIIEYINVFKGKSYYKEVCTTLIMFKKQGLEIDDIISYLKENYSRRPSLMARLNDFFE